MKQHINLYKTLPRPALQYLNERVIIRIVLCFIGLLFLITAGQAIKLYMTRTGLVTLQKKYDELTAKLAHESGSEDNIVVLQKELEARQQTLAQLHFVPPVSGCPYPSSYFQALSQASVGGLWLTDFQLIPEQQAIAMSGATVESLLILDWLKRLGGTPCFSAMQFHKMRVEKKGEENINLFSINSGGMLNGKN